MHSIEPIKDYLKQVHNIYAGGNATEHSYRGPLQQLLEMQLPEATVTNEPKRIACGAPDYVVTHNAMPLGYIEAKNIGESLDSQAYQDQLNRYRDALGNLIFTNYLEFRLYREGQRQMITAIAEIQDNTIKPLPNHFTAFNDLLKAFAAYQGQTICSAKDLAKRMADKARLLANVIEQALADGENKTKDKELEGQLAAFRQFLVSDITVKDFADMYAQTIAYGLFSARLQVRQPPATEAAPRESRDKQAPADFSRHTAAQLIPESNPFLRKFFQHIAGYDLDSRLQWIVDDLITIFRVTDLSGLTQHFGKSTQSTDTFIHFYETFLGEYDQSLRKSKGVYYTPERVVNFIIRAVDSLLKTEFNLSDGLADTTKIKDKTLHKVQILDPAAGTGTFLAEVVRRIDSKFAAQKGVWTAYVTTDLIPRLNGFEVMMAPYAIAHLKLEMLLQQTHFQFNCERLRIFLTNSLEEKHPDTDTLFARWLAEEAKQANRIKRDTPIMVVLGNPPYLGESQNKGQWIMDLMQDYKQEPGGGKLKEKNSKWLNDDYVKFIRLGQYFIDQNNEGILAYINNHSFLDNPTFRGMRWHLLRSFDKIFILDLHGNSKKKEISPDGSPDNNVFDIQQGVSINLFIKTGQKPKDALGEVFHFDLFGKRQSKYEFLRRNDLNQVPFQKLKPRAPHYFFVPKDYKLQAKYNEGFSVHELFPINSVGIVTARDDFTIHYSAEKVKQTVAGFLKMDDEQAREYFHLGADVRDWKVHLAREDLAADGPNDQSIVPITYRLFDQRYTYYTGRSKGFHCMPRGKVMRHFLAGENVGLVTIRRSRSMQDWREIFLSKEIISGATTISALDINYFFPLYLYPDNKQQDFETRRKPNLDNTLVEQIASRLGLQFTAEQQDNQDTFAPIDLLDYIYAVLYSQNYRDTYKAFLKTDFPRVPYPVDKNQFRALVKLGGELRALHLMESEKLDTLITTYPEPGDHQVTQVKREKDKVFINKTQYFGQVPETAWNFHIGGYQPAQKHLKDRKGRQLSTEEIRHYQKIIVALVETGKIMKKIDETLIS